MIEMNSSDLTTEQARLLRNLPSIRALLDSPELQNLSETLPASIIRNSTREILSSSRELLLTNQTNVSLEPARESELIHQIIQRAKQKAAQTLRYAINATGVVLHTGLGRARLAKEACEALLQVASGHSTLEIDEQTGRRGSRQDHVSELLKELTGAESALVLNNCAGAVLLAIATLAAGREVIISRGELVEIGGAFRMPDIIRAGGADLIEVGTTNRTRLSDYENAITDRTGLILRCHPSNFAIIGFTESTPLQDLVALGQKHNIPVMDDQGSGCLLSESLLPLAQSQIGLRDSILPGCDIVTASGDKLLGGPQAGIVLGKPEIIHKMRSHPLSRALRIDKLSLAALEATLRLYLEPVKAMHSIPTLRYLSRKETELRSMAEELKAMLAAVLPTEQFELTLIPENSQVGGGSLPGESLPTTCVALRSITNAQPSSISHGEINSPIIGGRGEINSPIIGGRGEINSPIIGGGGGILSADEIASLLRSNNPPIYARIKDNAILFDPRTLETSELNIIAEASRKLLIT